jgi:hypothetical protein
MAIADEFIDHTRKGMQELERNLGKCFLDSEINHYSKLDVLLKFYLECINESWCELFFDLRLNYDSENKDAMVEAIYRSILNRMRIIANEHGML